jgi:hypothetical protein
MRVRRSRTQHGAAGELAQMATQLQELVGQFKLSDAGQTKGQAKRTPKAIGAAAR